MGGGIAAMHYIGMEAMRLAAVCRFDPLLVNLSVVFAIVFSLGALLLAFDHQEERGTDSRKVAGAVLMGTAISAMHYTGMASATFMPSATSPDLAHAVSISSLGTAAIATVTLIVLGLAVWVCAVDRRLSDQARGLEYRVAERTRELTAVNEELRNEIAERQRAEEALQEAQMELAHVTRVLAMGELVASIAHEVNQPLSGVVINGNTCMRWLVADPPNLEEARETVQRIIRDGKRAGDVIARIRALARKTVLKKEPLDMNEVIHEVIALAQTEVRRNQVALRMELTTGLPKVLGDRVQLQQVVLNLVMNGIAAMNTVADRPRQLGLRTQIGEADQVRVVVQDSGTGLDPKDLERIFDAFYTTKPEGMGMGLSISRSIVSNHGGRLWATVNDGPGTSFEFTVPAHVA
jgi:C4-dicarboxylate-specific signal transduction histidine kinase